MRMRIKTGLQQTQKNCTQFSSGFSKSQPLPIYTTHPPRESEKNISKKIYINQDSSKDCYTND